MSTDRYKEFWHVNSMTEAWLKIVTNTEEHPADSALAAGYILEGLPIGGAALEVGAGVGRLMRQMSQYFSSVTGVDMSENMVEFSRNYLRDYQNCVVRKGDGYKLPVGPSQFDLAYSYITFQHMPDLDCVRSNIAEIFRALKPGAYCRVQTIQGQPYMGPVGYGGMHGQYFQTEQEFRQEFERAGFRDVTTRVAPVVGTDVISVLWLTARKP